MNIRESFTYSFLIHFFCILILLAISSRSVLNPISNWTVDIVVGDISTETREVLFKNNTKFEPIKISEDIEAKPLDAEQTEILDETASEDKENIQSQAQKNEDIPDAAESKQAQDIMLSHIYERMAVFHGRAFAHNVTSVVDSLIDITFIDKELKNLNGSWAVVLLQYTPTGLMGRIDIVSESEELRSILGTIDWQFVPLPSAYLLKVKRLEVLVTMQDNIPAFSIIAIKD